MLFLISTYSDEEIVLYRGTSDCILYDGINLGFISTTLSSLIAKNFLGDSHILGCMYEIHLSPGIPYICRLSIKN